jgi:hypothetical protein
MTIELRVARRPHSVASSCARAASFCRRYSPQKSRFHAAEAANPPPWYSEDGPSKYPPAVGYQTVGLDNKARNRCRARWFMLSVFRALAVKAAGSLVPSQARPAVWFRAPCSIQ